MNINQQSDFDFLLKFNDSSDERLPIGEVQYPYEVRVCRTSPSSR